MILLTFWRNHPKVSTFKALHVDEKYEDSEDDIDMGNDDFLDDDEGDWYQLLCPEPNLDIGDLNSKSPLF